MPLPDSNAPVDQHRQALKVFYSHYAPEKTDEDVEKALKNFEGRIPTMWEKLQAPGKYGPYEAAEQAAIAYHQQAGAAASSSTPAQDQQHQPEPQQQQQQQQQQQTINVEQTRQRIFRFYKHYAPEKATDRDVDTIIDMIQDPSKGGIEAIMGRLEQKHGLEKDIPQTAAIDLTPEEQAEADKLVNYYQFYGARRTADDCKNTLIRFRNPSSGGYDKMWGTLIAKYGPMPQPGQIRDTAAAAAGGGQQQNAQTAAAGEDPEAPRSEFDAALEAPEAKLRRFYDTHAPTRSDDDIRSAITKYKETNQSGSLAGLFQRAYEKYGAMPLPPPGYVQQWTRLRKYFNHYKPETKNSEIDWMLAKGCSTPTGISLMWTNLVSTYGVEPLDPEIEKAMKGPTFVTSRSIGEPPLVALSVLPRDDDNQFFRRPKGTLGQAARAAAAAQAAATVGSAAPAGHPGSLGGETVRLMITFAGVDYTMLEEIPLDRRRRIADSMEQQIALNAGLQARNIALIDYRGADAEFELSAVAGQEGQLFHAAASIVNRASQGSFSCRIMREVFLREARRSGLHLHATQAKVLKGATKAGAMRPPVSDPAAVMRESANPPPVPQTGMTPEEMKAIKTADEVARMSEQQRMSYSWKKSLEERLAGRSGTSLSYKRNNEAYREFMSNIWQETAGAFSSSPTNKASPERTQNPLPPKGGADNHSNASPPAAGGASPQNENK